jgi:hypothetical protein
MSDSPTLSLAVQVIHAFHSATKTISVPTLVRQLDPSASIRKVPAGNGHTAETHYCFTDYSVLVASGRGRSHHLESSIRYV